MHMNYGNFLLKYNRFDTIAHQCTGSEGTYYSCCSETLALFFHQHNTIREYGKRLRRLRSDEHKVSGPLLFLVRFYDRGSFVINLVSVNLWFLPFLSVFELIYFWFNGNVNLSKDAPRKWDEIEKLMKEKSALDDFELPPLRIN